MPSQATYLLLQNYLPNTICPILSIKYYLSTCSSLPSRIRRYLLLSKMSSIYDVELSFHRYWNEEWRAGFLSSLGTWINNARQKNRTNQVLDETPQNGGELDGPRKWTLMVGGGAADYLFEVHVRLLKMYQTDPNRPRFVAFGKEAEDKLLSLITGNELVLRRSRYDDPRLGWVWTCTYVCKAEGSEVPTTKDFLCEYLVELRERKLDPRAVSILEAAKRTL